MMMKRKLSKEKRNQLILVIVGTVAVLGALGFGLIKAQYDNLRSLAQRQLKAEGELLKMEEAVKRAEAVETVFAQASQALAEREVMVASGDLYSWTVGTVRKFQKNFPKVDLPQLSPISAPAPVSLLPNFPYKQVTMSIGGAAYYHDLGAFVAEFENAFPLIRIANLNIEPNPSPTPANREKLSFRMDLIALVRSGQP